MAYRWDPTQYVRYSEARGRPFDEMVGRIPVADAARVVDIGCGPGTLTASILSRWPDAAVTGVDSSADMIAAAADVAVAGRLDFVHSDLRAWHPPAPVDVVIGNAVLQWVPDHLDYLATIASWLAPNGALAFQVPDNFEAPSHTIIRDLRESAHWRDRLGEGADRSLAVERPEAYLETIVGLGLEPDVWQTTYFHILTGDDAVLEWVKGTALRPVLDALEDDPEATAEFLAECGAALLEVYPPAPYGTLLPFRRTFMIGSRQQL